MSHLPHNELSAMLPSIAFIGKAGAGKSSAADILCDHYFYTKRSLADPLKSISARIWGESGRSDRGKLQRLGVAVREIDEDAWVNLLVADLDEEYTTRPWGPRWVVDDVRFPNEFDVLRQAGFVMVAIEATEPIRIERLKLNGKWQSVDQLQHESETALDERRHEADYTIVNDEDPDALLTGLLRVLNRERR